MFKGGSNDSWRKMWRTLTTNNPFEKEKIKMQKKTYRYVTFYIPGIIFGKSYNKEIETLDPKEIEWPDNAYAFTLHEREDIIEGDKVYRSTPVQIGPMYYHPDSKIETLEEVKANRSNRKVDILINNMEINRYDKIIWTRWGNWPQPYSEDKISILNY